MGDSLKNKKVLVTGGAGYLGSFLVKALHDKGADVYAISKEAIPGPKVYALDILSDEELDQAIQQIHPEVVYHLAANIRRDRNFDLFESMLKVNVTGTFNLLKALEKTEYQQFIFTSTSEIYGNNPSPFHEDQIPMPVSPYSLTKVMAEHLIQTYSRQVKKNYTILRLFNFFGENMPEDFFISQMINSLKRGENFLMTKGEQARDFLYIEDVIRALVIAGENPAAYDETFNVCSGIGTPLASIAEYINTKNRGPAKIQLGALPYRENEVWEMTGSPAKIKEKLGFIPCYSWKEGVGKIW